MYPQQNRQSRTDHGSRKPRSGRGGHSQSDGRASQVVTLRNPCQPNKHTYINKDVLKLQTEKRIGTWNIRSLYQSGKAANLVKEMKRLKINILGCSEVRWPNTGQCMIDNHHIYYSGDTTSKNSNGVAVIVDEETNKAVSGFMPVSDRVALLKIAAKPCNLNILQVYAPTSDSTENEVESFYEQLNIALKQTKKEEINIVLGDFNAKVGRGEVENVVGNFGLGVRNERGDRLIQFCQEMDYVIMNTYFQLPDRRLYTWRSPADNNQKIVRNQIDYLTINRRFRNCITSAKTYPGADIPTDHNLLLSKIKLRLKKVQKNITHKIDIQKLKQSTVQEELKKELNEELRKNFENCEISDVEDIEKAWNKIKNVTTTLTVKKLKMETKKKKQEWMTQEILELMEERRKHRNRNELKYKEVHKTITKKIKETKELWLQKKCEEIEILQNKHDTFNLHKKIKEAAGMYRTRNSNVILDSNNTPIIESYEKLARWKEYMEELFGDEERPKLQVAGTIGPNITTDEVHMAIKRLKNNKTPGPDMIHGEILKLLEHEQVKNLTNLFNQIYQIGYIPKDWLLSIFIPLPKKVNATRCSDHRTISLMSHALKILLNIIHSRIYRKLEENISDTQFGFRNGLGTREALFSIQVLIQRARDVNCDIFACFIDFEKAFDKVQHVKLIRSLQEVGIDDRDIRIISNLYMEQKAIVKAEGQLSEEIQIEKGVRQGCILSPMLFNAYSENLFKDALSDTQDGVIINGEVINNLRYADDTVLISDSAEGLQRLIDRVVDVSETYGMKLNCKKTQVLMVRKNNDNHLYQFTANNVSLQIAEKVTYLGCTLNQDWDHTQEIKCRIEKSRSVFRKMSKVLCNLSLSLDIRTRVLRCYVFSVLLYGVEAWTLTDAACKRLEAFETWCYRRMLRISWIHRITNDTVMQRMRKDKEILRTTKERKLAYFGHVMRNEKYRLLQLILQGKIEGKRNPGRRRISWLKNLRQWTRMSSTSLFRTAVNKVMWVNVIANIHRG